jgi:transposase
MSNLFWLDDESWLAIKPLIPMSRPGVKPGRNRQVISGILHVLKVGCRWSDCPAAYGPSTTVYNRFNRWSKAGIWQKMLHHLVVHDAADIQCIDSTTAKAHRCSAGGKGGRRSKESAGAEAGEPRKSTLLSMATGV